MQMRMVCVDGLAISLVQVVRGEVGMEFRPTRESQLDAWEDLCHVLAESGRLAYSDRLGGYVIYITNFQNIEEAICFLKDWEFKAELVLQDEFDLIPK